MVITAENNLSIQKKIVLKNIIFLLLFISLALFETIGRIKTDSADNIALFLRIVIIWAMISFVFAVIAQLLLIKNFSFSLRDKNIIFSQGVFVKKIKNLAYQDIGKNHISQSLLDKILGVSNLIIEINSPDKKKSIWTRELNPGPGNSYTEMIGLNIGVNKTYVYIPGLHPKEADELKKILDSRKNAY